MTTFSLGTQPNTNIPTNSHKKSSRSKQLFLAQKKKFLELKQASFLQGKDPNRPNHALTAFLDWCSKKCIPGIVVSHEAEQSVISVYLPYPQLDKLRPTIHSLLPCIQTESSTPHCYRLAYECPNKTHAQQLAQTLANTLIART